MTFESSGNNAVLFLEALGPARWGLAVLIGVLSLVLAAYLFKTQITMPDLKKVKRPWS